MRQHTHTDDAGHNRRNMQAMTRSEFLRFAMAAAVSLGLSATAHGKDGQASESRPMHKRPIPSSGEPLPVVGCGTWQTFDVGPGKEERAPLLEVLRVLFAAGGSVIDSSPMYGRSEQVVGELLSQMKAEDKSFVATKVWTSGRDAGIKQMERSIQLLRKQPLDLMQIHNLVDWRTHLKTLRQWKGEGRIRYLGITHYTAGAYGELEAIMRAEKLDFVQLNYSLEDREAEQKLLPLAADRGIAVLVNQPFGGGGLLRSLANVPLPAWAAEVGCESWAQVLLKYVLSHPAVTCVIPGTGRPHHMVDNCRAGMGAFPDEAMRKRIVAWWEGRR
jgi:diketogulonate reductase-like aldo/keto reductase